MPSGKPPRGSRPLSREEEGLWVKVTEDIVPLLKRPNRAIKNPLFAAPEQNKESLKPLSTKTRVVTPKPALVPKANEDNPLDRKTRLRLNRGRIEIEARIDLHGMVQKNAHEALLRFLESAYHANKRHVLVITGKGRQTEGGIGVLRGIVPKWLTTSPMRNWVRGHSPAGPRDGGDGALYVSMKRFK